MGTPSSQIRRQHSAGGVVLSVWNGDVHVAMIATRGRSRWGLPKGALNDGETSARAALREVAEETNLQAEVVHPIRTIEYFFRAGETLVQKRVDFFLMRYIDGDLRPQLEEVDDVEWVPLEEALTRASFDSERQILQEMLASWKALPEAERQSYVPAQRTSGGAA
jgi:8-oxo-dGTP pyrophosphatase MutT (NUDIX family)